MKETHLNGITITYNGVYSTKQIAGILQCSRRYVQILCETGRLAHHKVGKRYRVPGFVLQKYLIDNYMSDFK